MGGRALLLPVGLLALLFACVGLPLGPSRPDLAGLHSWAIQLEGMERGGAVDRLSSAEVDLVVIDRLNTLSNRAGYPMSAVVRQLRASRAATLPGKLCLAYLNVGQAESYRHYWGEDWLPPETTEGGNPPFLLAPDPDGWASIFTVRYWDPAWRAILFAEAGSMLDGVLEEGFDGVMLDWVAAWEDATVRGAAATEGIDPGREMARLVSELSARARRTRPGFLVLLNGGGSLLHFDPTLDGVVDAVVRESLFFAGKPSARWDDPENADIPAVDTTEVGRSLGALVLRGTPVLTLDYASTPENRRSAETRSRSMGFIPFTTRTPLDRLPSR